MITRRHMIAGLGSAAVIGLAGRTMAATRHNIGAMRLTSLSDGHLVLPGEFAFDGLPQDELRAVLSRYDISPDELQPPCNVTLLRDDDRTVLFDAGAGAGFMPSAGALSDSLDAVGVAPEEITHVVFTHCHPDHLWGVLDEFDDVMFPDATYMMGTIEWDYWRDPATVDAIDPARAAFAVGAARRLDAIEERIHLFRDGEEILPGVAAVASYGHTPGHMSFELRSGTESMLIGGDAIGNHHVAFARPGWPHGADQDTALGAQTRSRLLDRLVQDQITLLGFHLPGGGLGRVERDGSAYRFVTEDM
ncbi:MBL fold metallo-hydrolase [Roseovarius pelagicus]|uniref:MBL fold metallo-hydrolase n=1 Tax=Roseovarius pelagicus TaxID=2980108 RepID=A0ABY6DDR4_9RHOB|nr:MBL fold metallo-hydrolase [Roseovarius pelagicus]UXX84248.1 MBL fold metallo-hydrolase [Roseovarius pelagicus]